MPAVLSARYGGGGSQCHPVQAAPIGNSGAGGPLLTDRAYDVRSNFEFAREGAPDPSFTPAPSNPQEGTGEEFERGGSFTGGGPWPRGFSGI